MFFSYKIPIFVTNNLGESNIIIDVRPLESEGRHAVKFLFKLLFTIFIVLAGYELMAYALRLLNLPSDRAVYEGTADLTLLLLFLPFALWRFWRSSL